MAYLINENTISIQESKRNIELINNNNNEEMCEIKDAQKEKKEEAEEKGEFGFEPTESKCDEIYRKQYSRSTNNNVQSYQCDIKQYDKDNHGEVAKCDKQDEVFIQETNNRKYEKNEYCEQFSESCSNVDTCGKNNQTQSSSNQTNSQKDNVNSKTNECTNHSISIYSSTNSSTISKAYSSSTSNSLSPKVHRATSVSNSGNSSRSNSERSFKYETSPKRNLHESSVTSCSSQNSLTCDKKMSNKDISVNDLNEELVEKWIMTNASSNFVDKLVQLKQNERTRQEIQQDKACSASMGRRSGQRFSSLETMSTNESSSNVSNSVESVSSYNDPMSSCMDLTIRNSTSTCNKRTSVTSDLFNLWISNSPIKRCKSPNR